MGPIVLFEHEVEVGASVGTAWDHWAKVGNWSIDASSEWVGFDGDLPGGVAGEMAHLVPPIRCRITESRPAEFAALEAEVFGLVMRFETSFEPTSRNTSRLRQRMTVEGPGAEAFAALSTPEQAGGPRAALERLAEEIEKAASRKSRAVKRKRRQS